MGEDEYFVGIDIGSSNVKTMIFNSDLCALAGESQEYTTIIPKPGWTEYNANEWWDGVKRSFKSLLGKTQIEPKQIKGIGISGLGACPVPMDEKGNVVGNVIPWSDQRAQSETNFLIKNCGDMIFKMCKNTPTTLNSTPHLMWIKNNKPELYKRIYKYTEPSGFLVQKFTGKFTMDLAFASSFNFGFDTRTLKWSEELIRKMGLDVALYPDLHKNMDCVGEVNERAASEIGISPGTKVFCAGLDIAASTVGIGAIHPGEGHYSMGSGANMMILTENQDIASPYLLSMFHAKGPELRILDGLQGSIGYSFRWFRDQLSGREREASRLLDCNVNTFDLMDVEAGGTKPGAGGVIYLPYLFGKFHPSLNPNARGVFFGLSSLTTRQHLIRSVMEGCSFDMYQSFLNHKKIGLEIDEIIASGGPSNSKTWCQIMADLTNTKVVTVNIQDASPFGDAALAAIGCGRFKDLDDVKNKAISVKYTYLPNEKNHNIYMKVFKIYEEIYEKLYSSFEKLSLVAEQDL